MLARRRLSKNSSDPFHNPKESLSSKKFKFGTWYPSHSPHDYQIWTVEEIATEMIIPSFRTFYHFILYPLLRSREMGSSDSSQLCILYSATGVGILLFTMLRRLAPHTIVYVQAGLEGWECIGLGLAGI